MFHAHPCTAGVGAFMYTNLGIEAETIGTEHEVKYETETDVIPMAGRLQAAVHPRRKKYTQLSAPNIRSVSSDTLSCSLGYEAGCSSDRIY